MILLKERELDDLSPCPYMEDNAKQFEYFLAHRLDENEIAHLLREGWRKFGIYFFRPKCPGCNDCIPIRVLAQDFAPTKSQRRNLKKNEDVVVTFGDPVFSPRAYEIYQRHSRERFSQESGPELFIHNFYTPSCPYLQSSYYFKDELIGVGFLDRGIDCLSTVYFFFDPGYSQMGIGTFSILKEIEYARSQITSRSLNFKSAFSILKEIEYARSLGLSYYYLGYYIAACERMIYKDRFAPREHYNWTNRKWRLATAGEKID